MNAKDKKSKPIKGLTDFKLEIEGKSYKKEEFKTYETENVKDLKKITCKSCNVELAGERQPKSKYHCKKCKEEGKNKKQVETEKCSKCQAQITPKIKLCKAFSKYCLSCAVFNCTPSHWDECKTCQIPMGNYLSGQLKCSRCKSDNILQNSPICLNHYYCINCIDQIQSEKSACPDCSQYFHDKINNRVKCLFCNKPTTITLACDDHKYCSNCIQLIKEKKITDVSRINSCKICKDILRQIVSAKGPAESSSFYNSSNIAQHRTKLMPNPEISSPQANFIDIGKPQNTYPNKAIMLKNEINLSSEKNYLNTPLEESKAKILEANYQGSFPLSLGNQKRVFCPICRQKLNQDEFCVASGNKNCISCIAKIERAHTISCEECKLKVCLLCFERKEKSGLFNIPKCTRHKYCENCLKHGRSELSPKMCPNCLNYFNTLIRLEYNPMTCNLCIKFSEKSTKCKKDHGYCNICFNFLLKTGYSKFPNVSQCDGCCKAILSIRKLESENPKNSTAIPEQIEDIHRLKNQNLGKIYPPQNIPYNLTLSPGLQNNEFSDQSRIIANPNASKTFSKPNHDYIEPIAEVSYNPKCDVCQRFDSFCALLCNHNYCVWCLVYLCSRTIFTVIKLNQTDPQNIPKKFRYSCLQNNCGKPFIVPIKLVKTYLELYYRNENSMLIEEMRTIHSYIQDGYLIPWESYLEGLKVIVLS